MVQIVENWSELTGRVEGVTDAGDDAVDLDVHVESVESVPGFANLLDDTAGRTIRVRLALEGGPPPERGDELRIRVRKAGPDRHFARPSTGEGG